MAALGTPACVDQSMMPRKPARYGGGHTGCTAYYQPKLSSAAHLTVFAACVQVPNVEFEKLAVRFMDIRKRVYEVRQLMQRVMWR